MTRRLRTRRFHRRLPRGGGDGAEWGFKGKDIYVDPEARKRVPRWFVPALAVVVIATLVFWGAPAAVAYLRPLFGQGGGPTEPAATQYGDDTRVVGIPVANVFDADDLLAGRATQVLYNEPVQMTGKPAAYGFAHVRLSDGTEGYMRLQDLVSGRSSVESAGHIACLMVTDLTKRILSHASSGTLLAEVMMGTLLFTDYAGDGVYRVTLPTGGTGWIGSNGVLELPIDGTGVPMSDSGRYFANSALAFLNVPYILNGVSRDGACPEGIARIAAAVNGVSLPRTLSAQMEAGEAIELRRDENGDPVYDDLLQGDLVFFSSAEDPAVPGRLGIYVDYAQVLTFRTGRSDIRIMSLLDNDYLADSVMTVRRIIRSGS